jgi:transposase
VFLNVEVPRVRCTKCGAISEIHPPFADPLRTYTRQLEQFVVDLNRLTTMKATAVLTGLSWDIVKDIEKRYLARHYAEPDLRNVRYIAVDEIAVRRGHHYMTVVMDLETGRVLHVAEGKDSQALEPFLRRLAQRRKTKLKAIAMDMSKPYAKAARDVFPDVPVVFDRFHVVKLVNECLDEVRSVHLKDSTKADRKVIQGARYLLLMGEKTLEKREKERPGSRELLQAALALNEPLNKGYYLRDKIRHIWDEPDRASAERCLQECIAEADASGVPLLKRLGRRLAAWKKGVLAYFDVGVRLTSGPLEGLNNKIKTLKRMAYGYRDMEFFQLKIKGLHESKYRLVG